MSLPGIGLGLTELKSSPQRMVKARSCFVKGEQAMEDADRRDDAEYDVADEKCLKNDDNDVVVRDGTAGKFTELRWRFDCISSAKT